MRYWLRWLIYGLFRRPRVKRGWVISQPAITRADAKRRNGGK